jgi:hypothetical protein
MMFASIRLLLCAFWTTVALKKKISGREGNSDAAKVEVAESILTARSGIPTVEEMSEEIRELVAGASTKHHVADVSRRSPIEGLSCDVFLSRPDVYSECVDKSTALSEFTGTRSDLAKEREAFEKWYEDREEDGCPDGFTPKDVYASRNWLDCIEPGYVRKVCLATFAATTTSIQKCANDCTSETHGAWCIGYATIEGTCEQLQNGKWECTYEDRRLENRVMYKQRRRNEPQLCLKYNHLVVAEQEGIYDNPPLRLCVNETRVSHQ